MNLIIETDVGHDPDDLFTILWLAAAGVNIRAIVVTPGDVSQIAVAKTIVRSLGLDIPVGCHKQSETFSTGKFHLDFINRYGGSRSEYADGFGRDIISDAMQKYPDSEWFVIGPPSNVGRYLEGGGSPPKRCTMQGGFLGYGLHTHAKHRLDKFEGKTWMPTFNMNGDRPGTMALMEANIPERRFCGKNVCHSVIFGPDTVGRLNFSRGHAAELFWNAASILCGEGREKKFHDPVAAVCHLHPEVGTWVRGRVRKMESGWGTELDPEGDYVLAELDRDQFWHHINEFC